VAACHGAKLNKDALAVVEHIAEIQSVREARSSDLAVVKHGWEWIIEVMKQRTPLLILWRFAKTNFVMFDALPAYEKHVVLGAL